MSCLHGINIIESVNSVTEKYKDAKKLYACLDEIAKSDEDNVDVDIKIFENFFKTGNTDHLFKDELLGSEVTDDHRDNVATKGSSSTWKIDGKTLLFQAMSIPTVEGSNKHMKIQEILTIIMENAPEMIFRERICRKHEHDGITPLHLAIIRDDKGRLLKRMRRSLKLRKPDYNLKDKVEAIDAKGTKFHDTVMMAGTPLGVATLKFDESIFKIVLRQFFSDLCVVNSKGDNIVHSLIKYAHLHPNSLDKSVKMLNFILDGVWNAKNPSDGEDLPPGQARDKTKQLLFCKNKEGLTPLQLAAKRQQFRMFERILQHEAYCSTDTSDGLFELKEYDITEIETLAPKQEIIGTKHEVIKYADHESILQYIITHQTNSAFGFTDCLPVKEVIRTKWNYYKRFFWPWFILHILFMSLLTSAALRRSKLQTSSFENGTGTVTGADYKNKVKEDVFVTTVGAIGVIIGGVYFSLEITRRAVIRRFKAWTSSKWYIHIYKQVTIPYSNTLFEIYFVSFAICLILDFAMASGSLSGYENYCLIIAVILGWYLVMFFIQTLKEFSFFTVLIQRVILDLARFAFVMSTFLISFSAAMSMVMQGANTDSDDFDSFDKTIIKMLTIMLGIGELGDLFKARHPALAILIFVLFVLLTTILLLNALIALMSNSCTDLMSSQGGVVATKMHCRLQKLSVILFLESYLPRALCKSVGVERVTRRSEHTEQMCRRFWSESSVQEDDDTKALTSGTIWEDVKRKVKRKSRKHTLRLQPTLTGTHVPSVQPTLTEAKVPRRTQLEIKDIDSTKCDVCQNENMVAVFTQELVVPDALTTVKM